MGESLNGDSCWAVLVSAGNKLHSRQQQQQHAVDDEQLGSQIPSHTCRGRCLDGCGCCGFSRRACCGFSCHGAALLDGFIDRRNPVREFPLRDGRPAGKAIVIVIIII